MHAAFGAWRHRNDRVISRGLCRRPDLQFGTRPHRWRSDQELAAEFDPQPFHLDEDAARNSIFRGLAASGWHTAALTMRLLVDSELKPAGGIVGAGFDEFRWPHPVRPGAPIEVASRAGADQGPNHHVQSGRQGCAGAGVEPGCATPDAACRSRRCPMSTPTSGVSVAR